MKVIGIDAYTLDRPFADMVADFRAHRGRPIHLAGPLRAASTREYCQIEKLATSTRSPGRHGFTCRACR